MGGNASDYPGAKDDGLHRVSLTSDYWIGVFPVTQKQFSLVTGSWPARHTGTRRPVESISYENIRGKNKGALWPTSSAVDEGSFLGILRTKSGLKLDLPTEAQWEYACRATTTTALNNGKNLSSGTQDSAMDKVGRYYYNGGAKEESANTPLAFVGEYLPNEWGLYDMHGNIGELCLDWFAEYAGDVTNPGGPNAGTYRVVRGGNYLSGASGCTSASRSFAGAGGLWIYTGFRLCCSTESSN